MRFWKIYCKDEDWPGLWRRFFVNQAVAVGYPALDGNGYGTSWTLDGESESARWTRTRNCLKQIRPGDRIVVQLENHCVGRIGEVVRLEIGDAEWKALVPPSKQLPLGEMGRRICVRWEMADAPIDPDTVVRLPEKVRFTPGVRRPALCEISPSQLQMIATAIGRPENWTPLLPHRFRMESAISDYIATYPHRLEEGFKPYLSLKDREHSFRDKTRSDVLLEDRDGNPVVVECKQHTPSANDVRQLRHYMNEVHHLTDRKVRGMLVHGGSERVSPDALKASRHPPAVEIVRYRYLVDFPSSA